MSLPEVSLSTKEQLCAAFREVGVDVDKVIRFMKGFFKQVSETGARMKALGLNDPWLDFVGSSTPPQDLPMLDLSEHCLALFLAALEVQGEMVPRLDIPDISLHPQLSCYSTIEMALIPRGKGDLDRCRPVIEGDEVRRVIAQELVKGYSAIDRPTYANKIKMKYLSSPES